MKKTRLAVAVALTGLVAVFLILPGRGEPMAEPQVPATASEIETATFGAGCFWCVEAVFETIRGVISCQSGYSGGHVVNPTYEQVCTGSTGHAEVVHITFDPGVVTYARLLELFWQIHDPTTPDRQGADVGPQYRSVVFSHSPEQKKTAEDRKRELDASRAFENPVVTEIEPFTAFYPAEPYHQDYYRQNRTQPYCRITITPKIEKVKKAYGDLLK